MFLKEPNVISKFLIHFSTIPVFHLLWHSTFRRFGVISHYQSLSGVVSLANSSRTRCLYFNIPVVGL